MKKLLWNLLMLFCAAWVTVWSARHHDWVAFCGWLALAVGDLREVFAAAVEYLGEVSTGA